MNTRTSAGGSRTSAGGSTSRQPSMPPQEVAKLGLFVNWQKACRRWRFILFVVMSGIVKSLIQRRCICSTLCFTCPPVWIRDVDYLCKRSTLVGCLWYKIPALHLRHQMVWFCHKWGSVQANWSASSQYYHPPKKIGTIWPCGQTTWGFRRAPAAAKWCSICLEASKGSS